MAPDEQPPLFFPDDSRRGLGSEVIRRIARAARLTSDSRVLDLGCGLGAATLQLAREFGCAVVAADESDSALEAVRRSARAESVAGRVETARVDYAHLSFAEAEFHLVLAPAPSALPLEEAVRSLRRLLLPKGRLLVCHPVRVGKNADAPFLETFRAHFRRPLPVPREVLQIFANSGFEPEWIESLSDSHLQDLYRALEQHAGEIAGRDAARDGALQSEIQLHRSQGAKASVSFAAAVGRRREPGEKPSPSRDRG